jgi:hypothetical protein
MTKATTYNLRKIRFRNITFHDGANRKESRCLVKFRFAGFPTYERDSVSWTQIT